LTFEDFDLTPELKRTVAGLGFETPTPIQESMIPKILEGTGDLVGLAHTGTGKTAAFGLPMIQKIDIKNRFPQALVLCPTRELCIQISKELALYGKNIQGLSITSIYGGDSYERQLRALKRGCHIIAATPGRLIDLLERGSADIGGIDYLILDEADIMLNMGFKDEIDAILESAPVERQTILLSATMPRDVAKIAENYMKNPVELSVDDKNTGPQQVEHHYYTVRRNDKYQALKRIVDFHPDIYGIIFCRTRAGTQEIAEKMVKDGYSAEALHGDLSQSQREHVMNKFRSRAVRLLVATDIAARGLDVDDLTHVIHYDLPTEANVYTHRSGRTGRAGKAGTSLALISDNERTRLRWIERIVKRKFSEAKVPGKREICEQQLMQLVERAFAVNVDKEQIATYLPLIEEKLSSLTREEIIERFISLEFNKFLKYYKNLKDLKPITKPARRSEPAWRSDSARRSEPARRGKPVKRSLHKKENGYDWLAVDLGKNNKVLPLDIIGLVNQSTNSGSIRLGRIDIGLSRSWFQVESESLAIVEKALRNATYKRRQIKVERVASSPGRAKKSA
jgi:ATP-dependent RNA helicase DeaD